MFACTTGWRVLIARALCSLDATITLPAVADVPIETPDVSTPSRAKIRKTSLPSASSPIVPTIALLIPKRLIVTAATAAGPPPARTISFARTLSSSPGYLSTDAIVSIVITPTQTALMELNCSLSILHPPKLLHEHLIYVEEST